MFIDLYTQVYKATNFVYFYLKLNIERKFFLEDFSMARILNFGSLNIDYVYTMDHFVQPGETTHSLNREVFAGGKGLNQSIAAKRAGGDVYHAGCVGLADNSILLNTLKEDKVNIDFVKQIDSPSGHTVIQVNKDGQNCIILFGGSNQQITCEHIDSVLSSFDAGDYLILQNEINNMEYLINKGYEKGLNICFNVSPFEKKLLSLPLEKCKYIIVNEIEGAALVDKAEDTDPQQLMDLLSAKFKDSSIVLTLGVHGSLYKDKNSQSIFVNAFKVNAVDTTAAGDTYLGYLITMLTQNHEPKEALTIASAASAIAVTKKGASPSIPHINEVMDFLKEHQ